MLDELKNIPLDLLRFPTASKTLQSRLWNILGLQQIRMLLARLFYHLRPKFNDPALKANIQKLRTEGYVLIEDFLAEEQFNQVVSRAATLIADKTIPRHSHQHGSTCLQQLSLQTLSREQQAGFETVTQDDRLLGLVAAAERRGRQTLTGLQAVESVSYGDTGIKDPETDLHIDIFFHTHKAWLYLEDVTLEKGPLVVVPRSHILDWRRLGQEYRESTGANRGSRRISDAEMKQRGLTEKAFTVSKNTLVIANTHAYHRRTQGKSGESRLALQMSFRYQPFIPERVYRSLRSFFRRA